MRNNCKQFVADTLKILEERKLPPEKVLLHKFLYFLSTQGVSTGFRFEPYTYGPYSFDLASTLGSMAFWDEIEERGASVNVINLTPYRAADPQQLAQLREYLDKFVTLFEGKPTFEGLECVGTALYCAEVIANHGDTPSEEAVLQEFKAWKKNKYSESIIIDAFRKLQPFLPQPI